MTTPGPNGEQRIWPTLQASQMKTYEMRWPVGTHHRPAVCAEVDCPNYLNGWRMGFDLTVPEKVAAANWVRSESGLDFTFEVTDTTVVFTFPAGQECLESRIRSHTLPLEREPLYLVRGGDFRGNPRGENRVHVNGADFADDWRESLERLEEEMRKG